MAAELVTLRQHLAFLTSSKGTANGLPPPGRVSPNGLPAQHGDSPLLPAATSGSLGITQVPGC